MSMRAFPLFLSVALALAPSTSPAAPPSYTLFESGQVRPLAMSPDGSLLFAVNTPDAALEVFATTDDGLEHVSSVAVGLEPVAVAARSDDEVWVVNHLSDSVSVVDVSVPAAPRVVRTLLVGDEPRDIVFAGPGRSRAFITAAHRGQNGGFDPQFTTAGVGRADVWVFDATSLGASLGGTALARLVLFGDTPRALAVSPDGSTVYAAVFHSGNRTTTVHEGRVPDGGEGAGGLPAPNTNHGGVVQPEVGLIVQHDGTAWRDELGRSWSSHVLFDLPDHDVFVIDANATPPAQVAGTPGRVTGVGTVLFHMAANPSSGKLYVSNLESRNAVRFEGPGDFAGSTVRGHLAESRISVVDAGVSVARHLNKHIDYDSCCAPLPNAENAASLAFPVDMAVTSDGATLYVAAFGSGKVGVFDTAELEADTFVPDPGSHIVLSGGGPSGLALDEARGRLYVLTRFDNTVSVVDTAVQAEASRHPLHDAEPASITEGRRFLYDAAYTSSHGDSACASCHIFGDFDSLAWDLGDPDGDVLNSPGPFTVGPFGDPDFHPMKGPMTTQSLRGMANHGPMHWRGDRTGGNEAPSAQPDGGAFDEDAAFRKFNGAFSGLLGRASDLPPSEMQAFTDFVLQVVYPPNPVANLDGTRTAAQQAGRDFYFGAASDTFLNCNGCHVLDPGGNPSAARPGFFGSDGRSSFENEPQHMKVAHLRNLYQKVGMFGMPSVSFFNSGDNGHKGAQVRGFGFLHDGSVDTVFRFLQATVFNVNAFNPGGIPSGGAGTTVRRNLEAFLLAFPSNLAPVVGQQITRTSTSSAAVTTRIDLLRARADALDCDLVAKGRVGGEARGWWYTGGAWSPDRASEPALADAALRALADTPGQEITFTCTPPGSGLRAGIDRDEDGYRDADEVDAGSDPADPSSIPGSGPSCGDGDLDAGEECDDGAGNSDTAPDACRLDCTAASCGDAVVDSGEACDDGVANSDTLADACRTDCTAASCGDAVIDGGEACDDGAGNSDVAPDACRTDCSPASCGDGVRDDGEACDTSDFGGDDCGDHGFDGGALACTALCEVDASACTNDATCGDGAVNAAGEQCDGADLDGQDCAGLGYRGGVLACDGACLFDEGDCTRGFDTRLLKLGGLVRGAAAQKFKLLSLDLDGAGVVFNALEEAVTVVLARDGTEVWRADLAAGDPAWRLAGDTLRWSSRSHPSGLGGLSIGLPGRPFTVKMKAKAATVVGASGSSALTVSMTVGDDTWTGLVPCAASSNPDRLLCR